MMMRRGRSVEYFPYFLLEDISPTHPETCVLEKPDPAGRGHDNVIIILGSKSACQNSGGRAQCRGGSRTAPAISLCPVGYALFAGAVSFACENVYSPST